MIDRITLYNLGKDLRVARFPRGRKPLHPVLVGRDRWHEIQTPGGPAAALPPPAALAGVDPVIGDVPALGEHNRKILRELGYSPEATDELIAAGVTTA